MDGVVVAVVSAGIPAMIPDKIPSRTMVPTPSPVVPAIEAVTIVGSVPTIPGVVPGIVPAIAEVPHEGIIEMIPAIAHQARRIDIVVIVISIIVIVALVVIITIGGRTTLGNGVEIEGVTLEACRHFRTATVIVIHIAQGTDMIVGNRIHVTNGNPKRLAHRGLRGL